MRRHLASLLLTVLTTLLALLPGLAFAQQPAAQPVRLRVVLVLDASGSMAANDPGRLVRVAAKMLSDLADERDRVTVISFGSEAKTLAASSGAEHDALRAAIETLGRSEMCTDYGRALDAAAAALPAEPAPGERRVVLFLTDGRFEPTKPTGSCGDFERSKDDERRAIAAAVDQSVSRLRTAGARVFAIGLGAAPARAERSSALLSHVASDTGGRVQAQSARDVPRIFAGIFGALVGSPVIQQQLDRGRGSLDFEIPRGADRLHVILVAQSPTDLPSFRLSRRAAASEPVSFEPARIESGTPSGYELAVVSRDAAGGYALAGEPTGPVEVLIVPDVGLALRFEGIPKLLPETERLAGTVALRTRLGDPVKLAPEFLGNVLLTVSVGGQKLFDQAPDALGQARFSSTTPLARGEYHLVASALHSQGLLEVAPTELAFTVLPQFELGFAPATVRFDTMAEPGAIQLSPGSATSIEVSVPPKLPADITLALRLPDGPASRDLRLEPTTITVGPDKPRVVPLTLRFADARKLRGEDARYQGELRLVPTAESAKLLTGNKEWRLSLDGRLRHWTLGRYLDEYWRELCAGLALVLLLLWLIGRAVAGKFPDKARIHYLEVGQQFESDSQIKRYQRRGAYRAARLRFPLGKKARPLVTFRTKGGGFALVPENATAITILDDTVPEAEREKHRPFDGHWDQRYRLADRYEVWLTRS